MNISCRVRRDCLQSSISQRDTVPKCIRGNCCAIPAHRRRQRRQSGDYDSRRGDIRGFPLPIERRRPLAASAQCRFPPFIHPTGQSCRISDDCEDSRSGRGVRPRCDHNRCCSDVDDWHSNEADEYDSDEDYGFRTDRSAYYPYRGAGQGGGVVVGRRRGSDEFAQRIRPPPRPFGSVGK